MIPDPSGQLAELIVYITSTRVDLYSHQIPLCGNTTTSQSEAMLENGCPVAIVSIDI